MVDERSLGSYELDHSSVVVPSSVLRLVFWTEDELSAKGFLSRLG